MRMIDADKLAKVFSVPACELFYTAYILTAIKDAPTVETKQERRGLWLNWDDGFGCYEYADCSECGERTLFYDNRPAYCSHCGAKMEV